MVAIESNTKSSLHIRCNSLPSAPHPIVSRFEEHLNRLKSSESASSSSSLSHKLSGLQHLLDCTDKLLQLPTTQHDFAREFSNKVVDELLDGSVRLLDVCGISKDCLLQSKESMHELQLVIRRRGAKTAFTVEGEKYLTSRKKVKKAIQKAFKNLKEMKNNSTEDVSMISMLKEAQAVTVSSLESLLLFVSHPKEQSKNSKWPVISKLMQPKRVASDSEEAELNEFEMVDSTLQSLISNRASSIEIFHSQMENLEICLQDLEEGVERISRQLIRTRVCLLNIFSN